MIYLDNAATTPVSPYVYEKMKPWIDGSRVGNPSSLHSAGKQARMAIEDAREKVASLIGARPNEIFFTSGGTEANNLALQGYANSSCGYIYLTSEIEHHAILEQRDLLRHTYQIGVYSAKTTPAGVIDIEHLSKLFRVYQPHLVSVMLVNNETGVVQPIKKVSELCRKYGATLHTDAVQAVGHMGVNVDDLDVDILSLSGHKFGAPEGVGALYICRGAQPWFESIICGGGQENNLRSGTENIAGIVGLGAAAELAMDYMMEDRLWCQHLKQTFMQTLNMEMGEEIQINGKGHILPHILNITIPRVQSEALLLMMDTYDVCISAASACSAGSPEPSHVLKAMGMSDEEANCTVRISFGRSNTEDEVVEAARILAKNAKRIRRMFRP